MFTNRFALVLITLLLIMCAVTACGGDDDDNNDTTATSSGAQPTNTQGEPVKIGALTAWSGAAGMSGLFYTDPIIKVVEKQVEDMGGILDGRPVEFVRCDTGNGAAEAAACAKKVITKEGVSALTVGGVNGSEASAISDVSEEEQVFFASVIPIPDIAERQYMVETSMSFPVLIEDVTRLILEILTPTPQTVGILVYDEPETRDWVSKVKQNLKDAGIDIDFEEYVAHGIQDFSPYLTNIKYKKPDVLIVDLDSSQMMAIGKQIVEQGGWGDIQVVGSGNALSAIKMPGIQGWIVFGPWHLSKNDPESIKFKEDFEAAAGKPPSEMHVYLYNTLWTAVHAIELAGTDDPVEIARAARSGNLEFETPMGLARFGTDGLVNLHNIFLKIEDEKTVLFAE